MLTVPRALLVWIAFSAATMVGEPDAPADRGPACLVEAGRFREALALLTEGAGSSEAGPESRILLGRAYLGLGRFAEAEASLASRGPARFEPHRLEALARVAEAHGDLDRAISAMTLAVEERRKSLPSTESLDGANALSDYRTLLGALAFRACRLDLAKDQFQKAISLVGEAHAKLHAMDIPHDERDPRLFAGGATAGLARVYGAQGDFARAERSWRGVMARTDDPSILMDLASFYLARDDAKAARRHLDRALRLSEGKPPHRGSRALLLAERKETIDEALALAEAAWKDGPDVHAIDTLAWVIHLRGEDDRAGEALRPALELGSKDPLVLYHAGVIAQARGKAEEAKHLLSRSIEFNPAFDPVASRDARNRLDGLR